MKKTKMRRVVSRSLALVCIVVLFVACNGEQVGSETDEILNDELSGLMFRLDAIVYTLPFQFSALDANGWVPCDASYCFETYMLKPGDSVSWELIIRNQSIGLEFTNLTEEVLPVSESYITGVGAGFSQNEAQVIFPGNIMPGSTYENVIAAHGEPGSRRISEVSQGLFYSADYFVVQIFINNETNLVSVVGMHYWGLRD